MEDEKEYDYIVRGSIIPFRATWYEQGGRNKIYIFFNLENSNKKKSCVRKLLKSDGEETTDANFILKEIYIFYSDLHDRKLAGRIIKLLHTHGELSTSQKEALISLTEKKDKDWED